MMIVSKLEEATIWILMLSYLPLIGYLFKLFLYGESIIFVFRLISDLLYVLCFIYDQCLLDLNTLSILRDHFQQSIFIAIILLVSKSNGSKFYEFLILDSFAAILAVLIAQQIIIGWIMFVVLWIFLAIKYKLTGMERYQAWLQLKNPGFVAANILMLIGLLTYSLTDKKISDPLPFMTYQSSLILGTFILLWFRNIGHSFDYNSSNP